MGTGMGTWVTGIPMGILSTNSNIVELAAIWVGDGHQETAAATIYLMKDLSRCQTQSLNIGLCHQAREDQHRAPISSTSRDDYSPRMPALASPIPAKQVPHKVEAFLCSQMRTQTDPASKVSRSASQADTPHVHTARHVTPPLIRSVERSADRQIRVQQELI